MERLNLKFGEPEICALAYPTGKEVTSPRNGEKAIMFTLVDGRVIFADLKLTEAIEDLQPRKGQLIELLKKKVGGEVVYAVTPVAAPPAQPLPPPATTYAAPPPPEERRPNLAPINPPVGNGSATVFGRFCSAYKLAVDIAVETESYCKSRGVLMAAPRFEDIRTLAATIIIDMQKGGH